MLFNDIVFLLFAVYNICIMNYEVCDMRRKDREITVFSKMTQILKDSDCCRLGLVDNGEAYIVPMNFGYAVTGETINLFFHCADEGRKTDLLSKQTSVAFEMDTNHQLTGGKNGCDFSYKYQSIMGTGVVETLTDINDKIYSLQRIMEHYTGESNWEFDENVLNITKVLKLSVEKWSCKELR